MEIALLLLNQSQINDTIVNLKGKQPVELSKTPQIAEAMQVARAQYVGKAASLLLKYFEEEQKDKIERLLSIPRANALLDINGQNPDTGTTVLHDFVRKKRVDMVNFILAHGGDPFKRDFKGVLPIDICKDEAIRKILKDAKKNQPVISNGDKSVGGSGGGSAAATTGGPESPSMKGYLKKWTNFTGGYKLRWFVLENGVFSYYKRQDDTQRACRGSINLKEAYLHLDSSEKLRFEVLVRGSNSKFHLKGNHPVETNRWVWALQNSIQFAKDQERLRSGNGSSGGGSSDLHRSGTSASTTSISSKIKSKLSVPQSSTSSGSRSSNSSVKRPASIISQSSKHSASEMFASTNSKIISGSISLNDDVTESAGTRTPMTGIHSTKPISLLDDEILPDNEEDEDLDDDDDYSDGLTDPESIDENGGKEQWGRFEDSISLEANAIRDLLGLIREKNKKAIEGLPGGLTGDELDKSISAITSSIETMESVAKQHAQQFSAQERYYQQKLEHAETKERLWAKNLRDLELEHEKIQGDLYLALQKRKEATKLLRVARRLSMDGGAAAIPTLKVIDDTTKTTTTIPTVQIPEEAIEDEEEEDEDDDDDEFFDTLPIVSEELEPETETKELPPSTPTEPAIFLTSKQEEKKKLIINQNSFAGYEDGPRQKLKLDDDDRPKISLWGVLKSLIGKDMTRMTLPVSFNECTNLLQRSAEDMEYTDILDRAAKIIDDPGLRLAHIAAFAASSYSSTINRIAKPFNPLLGETFEYCRPDCGYRLFSEQVSHHPPIGALFAESAKWDFYGASNVKSKFNGRSFDINPLGRWYLTLRPDNGAGVEEELYSFRKVTSSVVGIITGSPTVDNYGDMDIINHTLGYKCTVNFKSRGWSGKNAYELKGTIMSPTDKEEWIVGGRWNDKIIARRIIKGEEATGDHSDLASGGNNANAILLWKAHERPAAPFNLTSFAITLNALPEALKEYVAPTDTRFRPDQRAMEEGRYDEAADEKVRVEEKQRAVRRIREQSGLTYEPVWFKKSIHPVTGEECYVKKEDYWQFRQEKKIKTICPDIF